MIFKGSSNDSGISGVIGVILITVIVVVSSVIAYTVVNVYEMEQPVIANIDIESVDISNNQEVVLVHRGGDSFDVSDISIFISVNGETLDNNLEDLPVVGSTPGFYGALTGVLWDTPMNQSHDNIWDSQDTGGFKIAKVNRELHPGDMIKVTIYNRHTGVIISSPEYLV